jgi:hypothetical protein
MKKDLLIEVENIETAEEGLLMRTLNGQKFQDKVLISFSSNKIVVSVTELQQALNDIKEYQNNMEHPTDFSDVTIASYPEFEHVE